MPKISVVVPVYKAEPWLPRCIDSILEQTFTDFECILVDDGSPDNCGAICDEYAAKDSRFQVAHQKNAGGAVARNTGLDMATGDFIMFCDSDDCLSPYLMEYALQLQQNAEGAWPMWWFSNDWDEFTAQQSQPLTTVRCKKSDLKWREISFCYIWLHIYDGDLIRKHHLRFRKELFRNEAFGEDTEFNQHYMAVAFPADDFEILLSGQPLYFYFCGNPESVTAAFGKAADTGKDIYAPKKGCANEKIAELQRMGLPYAQAFPLRWKQEFTAHHFRGLAYAVYSAVQLGEALPADFFSNEMVTQMMDGCKQNKIFNVYYLPFKFRCKRFIAKLYQWDEVKHINYFRTLEIFYRLFFRSWSK